MLYLVTLRTAKSPTKYTALLDAKNALEAIALTALDHEINPDRIDQIQLDAYPPDLASKIPTNINTEE